MVWGGEGRGPCSFYQHVCLRKVWLDFEVLLLAIHRFIDTRLLYMFVNPTFVSVGCRGLGRLPVNGYLTFVSVGCRGSSRLPVNGYPMFVSVGCRRSSRLPVWSLWWLGSSCPAAACAPSPAATHETSAPPAPGTACAAPC